MPNDRPHAIFTTSHQRTTLRVSLLLLLLTIDDVVNLESTSHRAHRTMRVPRDEKLVLGREILKDLGLSQKPRTTKGKATLIKQSACKFLIDSYKYIANEESEQSNESSESSEFNLTGNDLMATDKYDILITFTAQDIHQGIKDSIRFDLNAVSPDHQIISAKLRLYRALDSRNLKNRGAFTVTAYRVSRPNDSETEMLLADSANTTAEYEGWITLDLTESLRHWMKHPGDNNGLYLSVSPIDRSSNQTRLKDVGFVSFDGDGERQPFVVGFFRKNEGKTELIRRKLRSFELMKPKNKRETSDPNLNHSCKVERLFITFKELHWDEWIIFPEGFHANYCSGKCKFPMADYVNITNHAIVQSIVNVLYPEKMPKVCCVPTKLYAVSALYFLNDYTTILFKEGFSNMSVRSCGCR